ncbi:acyl carrier protein [Nocardia sp. NPDC051832]|uniref:acyl carrier protein n=1 Tax=Nocardia sp. NPDC051832 TaxID=3155673 RepID=UPI00342774D6
MDAVEKVRAIVAERSGRPLSDIGPYSLLKDDLGLDSLDHVEIIVQIEKQFRLGISDEDAVAMKTVGDLVNYVVTRVN